MIEQMGSGEGYCASCQHWQQISSNDEWGICELISERRMLGAVMDGEMLFTRPSFGCNEWA